MQDQTISDTSILLLRLELELMHKLSSGIAENISSPDLSDSECEYWTNRIDEMRESAAASLVIVNLWAEQRKAPGLTGEIQELSATVQ
jgi:hypothetical protein